MSEVLVIIAVILAVAIAAVLILAATKPTTLRVQRSVSINAPPERIFSLISDFHQWVTWSPYEQKDPAMKRTYSGTERGRGAVYAWDGDKMSRRRRKSSSSSISSSRSKATTPPSSQCCRRAMAPMSHG
jgi:hypothetical protein